MPPGRSLRSRASLTASSTPASPTMSRTRRTALNNTSSNTTITVARVPSPENTKKSIRLTVKMPSNKLREATSGGIRDTITLNTRENLDPGVIVSGPRGTRAKRAVVIESGSEDEEDEEEEEAEEDDVEEDDEEEEEAASEEDAEGEEDDVDADGTSEEIELDTGRDTPMEDVAPPPPPPLIRMRGPASKPSVTITPATDGKLKSVEAKEIQAANTDDDEELSELDSSAGVEDADGGEEDAEGEEVGDEDQDMEQDDDDVDSDADTPVAGSRASTPDVTKMTKRQRSRLDQVMGNDFLQLPMEPQIKKHLTAEEHAMRRAEMARRRKNLSEKRNEEEKMDTINRLLKKQAPKRRGKISAAEIAAAGPSGSRSAVGKGSKEGTPMEYEMEIEQANPIYTRWISDREGLRLGVPSEWERTGVGRLFVAGQWKGPAVEEVEG